MNAQEGEDWSGSLVCLWKMRQCTFGLRHGQLAPQSAQPALNEIDEIGRLVNEK